MPEHRRARGSQVGMPKNIAARRRDGPRDQPQPSRSTAGEASDMTMEKRGRARALVIDDDGQR